MTQQYGVMFAQKFKSSGTFAKMDDTTHESHEAALREAIWLTHEHKDVKVLSVFAIDMHTGTMIALLDADDIAALYSKITSEDLEYFKFSRDLPLPTASLRAVLSEDHDVNYYFPY